MRIYKIPAIIVALLLLATIATYALDFGVELSNTVGIKKVEKTEFLTDHKETIWATIPFNNQNTTSLSIEGSFYASKPAELDTFDYYIDLDLFRLSFIPHNSPSGKIMMEVGRISVSDVTGKILNQAIDGFEVHAIKSFGNASFFAGYTGLLNARQEKNLMTADDIADIATDDVYAFGAKRAVAKAAVQFPNLFAGTDLLFEVLGQYDLRDTIDSNALETAHTAYGTLALTGPIASSFFYTVSGTFQTGILESDKKYSINALMGLARIDFFPITEANIFAEFLYTSGEDDTFSLLNPITYQSAGTLYGGGFSNIMKATAGIYYNPMAILNLDLGASIFMHPKEVEGTDGLYTATEVNAGATFTATSDLKLRLNGTLLFPKDEDMIYQAELTVVFAL